MEHALAPAREPGEARHVGYSMKKNMQHPGPGKSPPDPSDYSSPTAANVEGETTSATDSSASQERVRDTTSAQQIAKKIGGRLAPVLREILERDQLVRCRRKHNYLVTERAGNPTTLRLGTRPSDAHIAKIAMALGCLLLKREIVELSELLQSIATQTAEEVDVWCRVAANSDGSEVIIDLGDEAETRVRIVPGIVAILAAGCEVLFWRPATSRPMVRPARRGDIDRLKHYLVNLDPLQQFLLVAWITFTLAHAKNPTSKYPILLLQGGQGTGKSWLSRLVQMICDPGAVGLQVLPTDPRQLAIATQHAHLVLFDNLRRLTQEIADAICIASTGGVLLTRKLYTDGEAAITDLHGALVLNGIHEFVDQPDLAQRCMPLRLNPLSGQQRRTEVEMLASLQEDLPYILRGIFDEIASILIHLPTATVTNSQRMADFSRWLAAKEEVDSVPAGTYQSAYAMVVEEGQRDAIMNHPLAAALLAFAEDDVTDEWKGTPSTLLDQLCLRASLPTQRSMGWPRNAVSLSKKIIALQAALRSQGIVVELHRGKDRIISIRRIDHE
jgi:hypothetical protein